MWLSDQSFRKVKLSRALNRAVFCASTLAWKQLIWLGQEKIRKASKKIALKKRQ